SQAVAHRLAVDGQTLISRAIDFVPALQGLVQMRGGDADQHIAQDVLAGHDIPTLFATAAKALSRFLPQALRPIRDGLVTAHPAQHGPRGDPTVNLFWRIATEIYSLGEFQSLLHHSAR